MRYVTISWSSGSFNDGPLKAARELNDLVRIQQ
jgi:hypothetical protein